MVRTILGKHHGDGRADLDARIFDRGVAGNIDSRDARGRASAKRYLSLTIRGHELPTNSDMAPCRGKLRKCDLALGKSVQRALVVPEPVHDSIDAGGAARLPPF